MQTAIMLPRLKRHTLKYLDSEKFYCKLNLTGEELKATIENFSANGLLLKSDNCIGLNTRDIIQNITVISGEKLCYNGPGQVIHITSSDKDGISKFGVNLTGGSIDVEEVLLCQDSGIFEEKYAKQIKVVVGGQVDIKFKSAVSDINSFLNLTKKYLDDIDDEVKDFSEDRKKLINNTVLKSVEKEFFKYMNEKCEVLNDIYVSLEEGSKQAYRHYCIEALRDYFMYSDFARRALEKPLGYAGDYLQILEIFTPRDFSNLSLFSQLVSKFVLNLDQSVAHRNRIDYLHGLLKKIAGEKSSEGEAFSFASAGCGPSLEVQRFAQDKECENSKGLLIDMDSRVQGYLKETFGRIQIEDKSPISVDHEIMNLKQFLKPGFLGGSFDLIYCAGLFDYLSDSFCIKILKNLYAQLNKGGMLVFTNVRNNRHHFIVEALSEWFIITRTEEDMLRLSEFAGVENVTVRKEQTNTNLFVEITKL